MPSHSISRREALAGATIAAGAALLHQLAAAQTAPDGPFVFALITDTHLGRGGEKPAELMKLAVDEINASLAELTVHCGDLVNAGEVAAHEKFYPQWREIARALKRPWHAVPGNHDPVDCFTRHILPRTDYVVDRPGFRFICFRDAKPNPDHQGIVTPEQLKWLDAQLTDAASSNRRCFLVSHVIYHDNKNPDVGWMIKDGRAEFTELLKRHADSIIAFFAGHFHSGLRGWDDTFGIHEVVLPSACWNFEGKRLRGAPGYTFDEDRPAWVLAEVTEKKLTLKYRPIGGQSDVIKELAI